MVHVREKLSALCQVSPEGEVLHSKNSEVSTLLNETMLLLDWFLLVFKVLLVCFEVMATMSMRGTALVRSYLIFVANVDMLLLPHGVILRRLTHMKSCII